VPRRGVAGAHAVGSICGDDADELPVCHLVQQVGQRERVADPTARDLNEPDFLRFRVDPEVNLAPLPLLRRPVLIGQPFAIAFDVHAVAVDQQVQGTFAGTIGDVDSQGPLATAMGDEVRHRPIQSGQLQQALHPPGQLPQRQSKERLQRQARLDCGIGKDWRTPALAGRRGKLLRLWIEPDLKRSALRERCAIVMPFYGVVDRGLGLAYAERQSDWIRTMNPASRFLSIAGQLLQAG
jgi:hypothetical protein